MNANPYPQYPASPAAPVKTVHEPDLSCAVANGLKKGRRIAALCCLAAAYFGVDSILHGTLAVTASFSAVAAAVLSAVLLYKNGAVFRARQLLPFIAAVICGVSMGLVSSGIVKILALLSFLLLLLYWMYSTCRPAKKGDGNTHSFCDALFCWFVMPFAGFSGVSAALFCSSKKKKEKSGHPVLWTLVGLLVAVPVTVLAAWLLLRGDELFKQLMKTILDNWWKYIRDFLLSVLVAFPFASALYSALDTNLSGYFPRETIAQRTNAGFRLVRRCPNAAALGATIPLCVLYLLFFGVQAGYFLSAFKNCLPENFTFAEYARRGFFELCIVALINLVVILLAIFFCRRKENGKGGVLRFITASLSVMTLILIAIAVSKMAMYVSTYGLTYLRFYTLIFLVFLAFLFLFILLYALLPRFPAIRCILTVFFAVLLFVSIVDADILIAKVNVNRYLSGQTEEFDIDYFNKLSNASNAVLVPIARTAPDTSLRKTADHRIEMFLREYESTPVLERSLSEVIMYHRLQNDGYRQSSRAIQVTVMMKLGYFTEDIESVTLHGKDWSETVSYADGQPFKKDRNVTFLMESAEETEEIYVTLKEKDRYGDGGFTFRSQKLTLSPADGNVRLIIEPHTEYTGDNTDFSLKRMD